MITRDGFLVEFCILQGGCNDLQRLLELPLSLLKAAQLFVDSGYNFYDLEDYLSEEENLNFKSREIRTLYVAVNCGCWSIKR
jgi:hypothetical protein